MALPWQCPEEDEKAFQDITKHRFFNTNNLWINLAALKVTPTLTLARTPTPTPAPTLLTCRRSTRSDL